MATRAWNLAEPMLPPSAGSIAGQERQEEWVWLDRCSKGDERAIRWVLNRYRDRVVRLAAHVLKNSREAEDVAQEAFVKAFRQIEKFRGDSSFYAWLYRIVINLCVDRMHLKSATAEIALDTELLSIRTALPDMEKHLIVEQVLNSLTPRMRSILMLREVEGLEYAEIATVLNIPVGTVRSRLNAAREQFRRRWTAVYEEVDRV